MSRSLKAGADGSGHETQEPAMTGSQPGPHDEIGAGNTEAWKQKASQESRMKDLSSKEPSSSGHAELAVGAAKKRNTKL